MECLSVWINPHHHLRRHSPSGLRVFGSQLCAAESRRPSSLEAAGNQDCRRGSHHPSEESSSARAGFFVKPTLQSVSESERSLNHALVSIQLNYVAHSLENRSTALTSAKVLVHGSASPGIYLA